MARQKDTLEARILEYFQYAPAEPAKLLFGLVSSVMRRRLGDVRAADAGAGLGEKRRPGRPRKTPQTEVVE